MKNSIYSSIVKRLVVLAALTLCIFCLPTAQPATASVSSCIAACDARATTCETNCMHTGGNVQLCVEGCRLTLSACITICNRG
jgi:hypothetical protein